MPHYSPTTVSHFFDKFSKEESKSSKSNELRVLVPREIIKKFMPKIGLVLDAGGGPGNETVLLAKHGLQVVLLDLSQELIAIAKKKVKKNKVSNKVYFLQGDITNLSMISNETFDFVVCVGDSISCCVSKYKTAIKELARVTKKGSLLVIGTDSKLGAIMNAIRKGKIEVAEQIDKSSEFNEMDPSFKIRCFLPEEIIASFKQQKCWLLKSFSLSPLSDRFVIKKQYTNLKKFKRLLKLELKYSDNPHLLGSGDHFLFVFQKKR